MDTDHLRTTEGPSGTAHIVVDDEGGNAIVVVPGANAAVDHLAPATRPSSPAPTRCCSSSRSRWPPSSWAPRPRAATASAPS